MPWTAHPDWNPWANCHRTLDLYRRRCRQEAEEMTCAAQAARILAPLVRPGETLLDAGCGGGYYYHSFHRLGMPVEYHGLDYTPEMIDLAHRELCPRVGLPPERFRLDAIEMLDEDFDTVVCFNCLTMTPHYGLPLERLLVHARRRLLLRECLGPELIVRFSADRYLDEGKQHIRVYHNCYPIGEVTAFMENYGFKVTPIVDERTRDGVERVVDIPHTWRVLLAERC